MLFKELLEEATIEQIAVIRDLSSEQRKKLVPTLEDMGYKLDRATDQVITVSEYNGEALTGDNLDDLKSYLEDEGYMNESTLKEFSTFLKFLANQPQGEKLRKEMGDVDDRSVIINKSDDDDDDDDDEIEEAASRKSRHIGDHIRYRKSGYSKVKSGHILRISNRFNKPEYELGNGEIVNHSEIVESHDISTLQQVVRNWVLNGEDPKDIRASFEEMSEVSGVHADIMMYVLRDVDWEKLQEEYDESK